MSRYVKICQDMLRYVKICQDMSRWQKPSYTPALCLQASTKTITNHYTSASIGLGLWSNHYCESPQHTRHTTVSFYITAVTAPEDFRSGHSDLRLAPVGTVFLCALYSFLVFVSRRRIGRTAAVCSAWRRRTKHCCAPKERTKHSWAQLSTDWLRHSVLRAHTVQCIQCIAVYCSSAYSSASDTAGAELRVATHSWLLLDCLIFSQDLWNATHAALRSLAKNGFQPFSHAESEVEWSSVKFRRFERPTFGSFGRSVDALRSTWVVPGPTSRRWKSGGCCAAVLCQRSWRGWCGRRGAKHIRMVYRNI